MEPRLGKSEFITQVITKDLWQRFIKSYPEYSDLKWSEFFDEWKNIASLIREHAVKNPLGIKLGSYTGEIKLQFLPYKFKAKDVHILGTTGEVVHHLNIPTRGKVATVKWERRWAVKYNEILQYYAFSGDRNISTMAYKYILENPDALRVSRNTLGGFSKWRSKIKKK